MKAESGLTSSALLGRDLEIDFRFPDFNYELRSRKYMHICRNPINL